MKHGIQLLVDIFVSKLQIRRHILNLKLPFLFLIIQLPCLGQLVTASCVHGQGISYILDAYLASLGACKCEREGVLLTSIQNCEKGPFVVEFEDNFDGDSLDLKKWELPGVRGGIKGAQNMGVYTLNNVSLSEGSCFLTGKREHVTERVVGWKDDNEILEDGSPNLRSFDLTSGMIKTKQQFFYGKYELRCKLPKGNGLWPAFWTFGGKRWNEIDFFDNYAGTNEFVTSLGHDFEGTGKPNGCNFSKRGFDFTDWHTFTCIFEYDKMTVLIDDEIIRVVHRVITMTKDPVECGDNIDYGTYYQLKAYPMEPMNMIINLALISENGPGSSKPVDDTTPFPSSFELDYVRFWKRVPSLVSLYPNPGAGKFKLYSNTTIKSVSVNNMAGDIVYQSAFSNTDFEFDLSAMPDGVYLLKAELEGINKTLKLVKISP